MLQRKKLLLGVVYVLATIQFAWCYLWITRPYINTFEYEMGVARMPFQGRMLMMLPMQLAHASTMLHAMGPVFKLSKFWFPRAVQPEVLMQAAINVICLLVTGWMTTQLYKATTKRGLLAACVYPLVLMAAAATYMLHTVQNFRFIYDLPSLAFFSTAMWLIYTKRHWGWFVALFVVATLNRETTLLLLPLYMIDAAFIDGRLQWKKILQWRSLAVVAPLSVYWAVSQAFIRFWYYGNKSEFYPRLDWNIKSLLLPTAWPQLLSACGYLLLFVVVMYKRIPDARLKAWLWMVPIWVMFMFSYGILIETRVFGELIPLVCCSTALIFEEVLVARMVRWGGLTDIRAARVRMREKLARRRLRAVGVEEIAEREEAA
jgi:hypothetical protein